MVNSQKKTSATTKSLVGLASLVSASMVLAVPPNTPPNTNTGNRYTLERSYLGEISSAETYRRAIVEEDGLVILDVRDVTEHTLGHPAGSFSVPFPRIYRDCVNNNRTEDGACAEGTIAQARQDPEDFFDWVYYELGIPTDTDVATLCRTGFRSVLAANILSNPIQYICEAKAASDPTYDKEACEDKYDATGGYASVKNIWQGFSGQPIAPIQILDGTRYVVGSDAFKLPKKDDPDNRYRLEGQDLDLDNDGNLTANDKDGWRYHQGLPYSTDITDTPLFNLGGFAAAGCYDTMNVAGCADL
jgi:rhodanese-related sulfurtransferase